MSISFVLCLLYNIQIVNATNKFEKELMKILFSQYNPLITPMINYSKALDVYVGLSLSQIINVYEKEQIVKVNVWLQIRWMDYQLKWNPDHFDRLESIRVPYETVWTPDIVLFNNADGNYEVTYKSNVVISSDGQIMWVPPAIYKCSCTINVQYFPFDEQICELRFGSWTFDVSQVRFGWYSLPEMELSDYVPSGTWTLVRAPAEIRIIRSKEKSYETTEAVFLIVMRRKSLFFTINLVLPTMILSFLSVTVLYLPGEAGEKMTLCVSILLALVFFMLLISKILPPTSVNVPLISKYLMFTFILNLLTVASSTLILNVHYQNSTLNPIPNWIRLIFVEILPSILLLRRPYSNINIRKRRRSSLKYELYSGPLINNCLGKLKPIVNLTNGLLSQRTTSTQFKNELSETNYFFLQFLAVAYDMKCISKKFEEESRNIEILTDWKFIASVIDRMLLILFIIVTIVGTLSILLQAPNLVLSHVEGSMVS